MVSKTRVLFDWAPNVLDRTLGERFRERLAQAGFQVLGSPDVRDPKLRSPFEIDSQGWHRDPEYSYLVAVWSNVRPTKIKFNDGRLLEALDGDVIVFDNTEVEHAAPMDHTERWFIRALVEEHTR